MIARPFFPAALTLLAHWLTPAAFAAFAFSSPFTGSTARALAALVSTFDAFAGIRPPASARLSATLSAEGFAHGLPLRFIQLAVAIFIKAFANLVKVRSLSALRSILAFSSGFGISVSRANPAITWAINRYVRNRRTVALRSAIAIALRCGSRQGQIVCHRNFFAFRQNRAAKILLLHIEWRREQNMIPFLQAGRYLDKLGVIQPDLHFNRLGFLAVGNVDDGFSLARGHRL